MTELPASLAPAEPLARAVYESGWRQPFSDGPTRDELIDVLRTAVTTRTPARALVSDLRRFGAPALT